MSQDWVANLYTTATVGDTTLSNMELMFATLRSCFSGTSAPSSPVDGNLFYDTDTDLLKLFRNAAWVGVMAGSAAFKIWVYLNAAEDGWAIDSSAATDRVLTLKGGSTYLAGGANHGSWTISGLSSTAIPNTGWGESNLAISGRLAVGSTAAPRPLSTTTKTPTISQSGAWRPAGATGTLQYQNTT